MKARKEIIGLRDTHEDPAEEKSKRRRRGRRRRKRRLHSADITHLSQH